MSEEYSANGRSLGKRPRERVRELAWLAFTTCPDEDSAKERARELVKDEYGSIVLTILIGVLIRLAIELIVYWIKIGFFTGGKSNPPTSYQPSEPGYIK